MLQIESVRKTYGARGADSRGGTTVAVDDVDLAVDAGETVALIGPSGCGKSTLLRLIIGLVVPDGGRVRFEGETVEPSTVRTLRRRMGYVIQSGGLFPHLTARENCALQARHVAVWDAARIDERVDELAALTHLDDDLLDRFPTQLSGGQRQRVSLVRALMLDPDLLLLDEPLGALDPMIRAELQDELRSIFETLGKTVVLVTHDLPEAGFFARRIVLLRDGRIVQEGSWADLRDRPADEFVRRFFEAQRFSESERTEDPK